MILVRRHRRLSSLCTSHSKRLRTYHQREKECEGKSPFRIGDRSAAAAPTRA